MKDSYLCTCESDLMATADRIIEDAACVPEEVREDMRQEICLYFLIKRKSSGIMKITRSELINLLTSTCRKYVGTMHRIPNPNIHDNVERYFNFV